jgi:hypothetical protein
VHGRGDEDDNELGTCGCAVVLFISGVSQPLTHSSARGLSAALVLCRTPSMPPYHSHYQPRGSSNVTKQSSTTSAASLCAYTRTRIHGASSNKGIEGETPPAALEGSRSPARIGRLRACTAELFEQALTTVCYFYNCFANGCISKQPTFYLLLLSFPTISFYFLLILGKRSR